jgi:hypothetical protein
VGYLKSYLNICLQLRYPVRLMCVDTFKSSHLSVSINMIHFLTCHLIVKSAASLVTSVSLSIHPSIRPSASNGMQNRRPIWTKLCMLGYSKF